MRQNTQLELAFAADGRGEAPEVAGGGTEPRTAERRDESPANNEQWMERVCERTNCKRALARVRTNRGSPGVDGMTVEELPGHLREHWPVIREQLLSGTYRPQPVRRVYIPKPGGGRRKLGIPTVLDRFVQQAVAQVLQQDWDRTFSEHSYGFRPRRSAHQAVKAAQQQIAAGRRWVVDFDLEKFLQLSSYCPPTDADCPNGPQFLHKSFLFSSLRHDSRNRTTVSSADLTHCNSPLRGVSPPRTGSDGYRQAA